eukprot:6092827-Pleurochrysis_carterae.AAC.3
MRTRPSARSCADCQSSGACATASHLERDTRSIWGVRIAFVTESRQQTLHRHSGRTRSLDEARSWRCRLAALRSRVV